MNQFVRRGRRALAGLTLLGVAAAAAAFAAGPGARSVTAVGADVTIGTSVHNANHDTIATATVGTLIHPAFVVSGASGTPTGGLDVEKWNNSICSGTHDYIYGGVLTNGALDAGFLDETSTAATAISYRAHYHGDATYAAKTGTCTNFTFTKASPSVTIRMHDVDHAVHTSFPVTSLIHASVTVTGRVDTPTGSVRVRSWANGTCSGASGLVGPYALVGGTVDTPFQFPMNTAGTFSFRADYLGDTTYSADVSTCLAITITKFTPTFAAVFHDEAHNTVTVAELDDVIHAAATLSGTLGTPTGTVTVRQWTTTPGCDVPPQLEQTIAAAAVMDPAGAGAFGGFSVHRTWQLVYEGDDHYEAVTGPCMTIYWKTAPTAVSLSVHDGAHHGLTTAPAGTTLHLRAVVAGAFATPTGKVTLHRYGNATCSGSGTTIGSPSLTSGVVDKTGLGFTYNTPGTYSFRADYLGDTSYKSKSSPCVTVTITAPVATPSPSAAPTAAPTAHPTATPPAPTPTAPSPTAAAPSAAPSPSPAPEVTAAPSSGPTPPSVSAAPGGTGSPGATGGDTASPGTGPTSPSGDSGSGSSLLLPLGLLVIVAIAVGFWFSRRRNRPEGERTAP